MRDQKRNGGKFFKVYFWSEIFSNLRPRESQHHNEMITIYHLVCFFFFSAAWKFIQLTISLVRQEAFSHNIINVYLFCTDEFFINSHHKKDLKSCMLCTVFISMWYLSQPPHSAEDSDCMWVIAHDEMTGRNFYLKMMLISQIEIFSFSIIVIVSEKWLIREQQTSENGR